MELKKIKRSVKSEFLFNLGREVRATFVQIFLLGSLSWVPDIQKRLKDRWKIKHKVRVGDIHYEDR